MCAEMCESVLPGEKCVGGWGWGGGRAAIRVCFIAWVYRLLRVCLCVVVVGGRGALVAFYAVC